MDELWRCSAAPGIRELLSKTRAMTSITRAFNKTYDTPEEFNVDSTAECGQLNSFIVYDKGPKPLTRQNKNNSKIRS